MGNLDSLHIVIIILYFVLALLAALWIWMLIECARYESNEGNTKIIWILILLMTNWIGALLYLFIRRPQRKAELGR